MPERDEIKLLGIAISDAIKAHMLTCEEPCAVYPNLPIVLAMLAGCHVGTLARAGLLADGEVDKTLEGLVLTLRTASEFAGVDRGDGMSQEMRKFRQKRT